MSSVTTGSRVLLNRERFVGLTALLTILIGGVSLFDWLIDAVDWRPLFWQNRDMKANAALCFVVAGIALGLIRRERPSTPAARTATVLGLFVATIAGLTLLEWIGAELHIDELLAADTEGKPGLPPGRMGPLAAVCLLMLGGALFSAAAFSRERIAQWLALFPFFFFLAVFSGHVFGATGVYEYLPFGAVALNASLAGTLLGAGVVAAAAKRGPLTIFTGEDLPGMLARRWLLPACLAPALLGWLVLQGAAANWYPARFAYALFGTAMIVTLTFGVLLAARQIRGLDEIRRTAEVALRAGEARFRQLADSMPQIVWTARPDGRSDYINRRWLEYTGIPLTHEDDAWRKAVHPDDLRKIDQAWDEALRTGEFHQIEYRLRDVRYGDYRWHLEQAVAGRDEAGNIERWYGSSTDIDALKRADEALASSERRFRLLLEGLPQLVWTCSPDGRCDYLSRQWVDYTGVPEAEQLGYGWSEAVHPDDRAVMLERWRKSVATGEPYDAEFRIRGADGAYRWFMTRAFRFQVDDGTEKWFGTNTDIEEQKQIESRLRASERVYRAIGESIDYGVWICSPDGRNTYASPSFLNLVGLTQEQCSEFGWGNVLHPDDAERTMAAWRRCVAEQRIWDVEHRFRAVDGKIHSILARGVPVFNERGAVVCWAGINLDITRLKEAEDALRELNATLELRVAERTEKLRQAEEAQRQALLRRRFVEQTIAAREDEQRRLARELHDGIGQSLTSLRMTLRVVEQADDLAAAQAAARELRPIVVRTEDEVRRLTRNLRPAVLDDLGLVPALSRLAEEVRLSRTVQVRFDGPRVADTRLPAAVETALYRIAQEALTNVVKHARAQNVELQLDCAPSGVQLTVTDDGIGYDAAARADDAGRFGIIGMRERVALLNGAFEIEPRPTGGTTILVTIPFPEDAA
jgi:PAS domain S-box-containing protein